MDPLDLESGLLVLIMSDTCLLWITDRLSTSDALKRELRETAACETIHPDGL